jgi:hypothetical protein
MPKISGGAPDAQEPPAQLSVSRERRESDAPFWKRKPEWRRRLMEERAVVVSVSQDKVVGAGGDEIKFTIRGAGLVSAPKGFSFRTAQQYAKLKSVSTHFRTVEFHEPSRKLHLVLQALGYQARMVLKLRTVSEDWRDEIQWDVIWGDFRGMKGVIAFEPAGAGRTETSIESVYQAQKRPLPKILMGLALEAVAQKVAGEMRAFIETEFRAAALAAPPSPWPTPLVGWPAPLPSLESGATKIAREE